MRQTTLLLQGPITEAIKELCRQLKKQDADKLPGVYVGAMKASFQRHLDDDHSSATMQQFMQLSKRIVQTYAGFNAAPAALLKIAQVCCAESMACPLCSKCGYA